jgi:hypothetical protein
MGKMCDRDFYFASERRKWGKRHANEYGESTAIGRLSREIFLLNLDSSNSPSPLDFGPFPTPLLGGTEQFLSSSLSSSSSCSPSKN